MMKGFKIDVKGQRQRMKYQERQRVISKVAGPRANNLEWTWDHKLNKGQLSEFVSLFIK